MSGIGGVELPSEVSVNPSHSMNSIDEDDDWVIVKKQRITILVPPPSPAAASPQAGMPKISSKQTSLTRKSRRNCNGARKKHPKQLTTEKSQHSPLEGIEVDCNSEKAQANPSESMVHQDVPRMGGEILSCSLAAPVVKSEWTEHTDHAVQGLFHEDTEKATSSFGNIYRPRLPIISSHLTNKVMRARLLEKRVAGFGGLRNWLLTCGFGWFVEILDSEQLGMCQIVSLTMNQLKEMGLVAVGPRRKLIHAIDSLCRPYQPHQFEMVS